MKIALCFFGMTRSLRHTHTSIQTHILDVLRKHNIDYTIFMHTYKVGIYRNMRAGDSAEDMDADEYKLLDVDVFQMDDQDRIRNELQLEQYRTHPDPWNTEYQSVDNFILAQYSKWQVTQMVQSSETDFDYVVFLRPDVQYLTDLSLTLFGGIGSEVIAIPNFLCIKEFKFNDKFAITHSTNYKVYGSIFSRLLDMSRRESLHSEQVIGRHLVQHGIQFRYIPFYFVRIRANGKMAWLDWYTYGLYLFYHYVYTPIEWAYKGAE